MSSLVASPVRFTGARTGSRNYWTIHADVNRAFGLKMNERTTTAIVGFRAQKDATTVGLMLETYYMMEKEWPNTMNDFYLPAPHENADLFHLFFRKWDCDDLKVECTKNFLNMFIIENIDTTKKGFKINGKMYSFEAPTEFYIKCLDDLYSVE